MAQRAIQMNEPTAKRRWETHPAADLINGLCPCTPLDDFPYFEWVEDREREPLRKALAVGFNAVQERFEETYMERALSGSLTLLELRALHHIKRKTFPFGKLLEAMTLSSFTGGAMGRDGELQRTNSYASVVSPGIGPDRSNANKALRGLLGKGLIDRALSTWHSQRSVAYVYCALPLLEALRLMLRTAQHELARTHPRRAEDIIEPLVDLLNEECAEFIADIEQAKEAATRRKILQPVAKVETQSSHGGGCSSNVRGLAEPHTVVYSDHDPWSARTNSSLEDNKPRKLQATGDRASPVAASSSRLDIRHSTPEKVFPPQVAPAPSHVFIRQRVRPN